MGRGLQPKIGALFIIHKIIKLLSFMEVTHGLRR